VNETYSIFEKESVEESEGEGVTGSVGDGESVENDNKEVE